MSWGDITFIIPNSTLGLLLLQLVEGDRDFDSGPSAQILKRQSLNNFARLRLLFELP